ncbi:MAG: PIG-L family deacetylase [Caldilineales bacterium]|nr:PIG-L family deacetylase [Caldilineales bacterium]
MTKVAFAICAHPDDIEFMMAGTLILLKQAGYEIHYMTVANGSCGSVEHNAETIARIRRQESVEAAESIGAIYHDSLCPDLEIFYNADLLKRLSAVVREVAPDIVLTHPPQDYMEDHMNTCRLAVTAAFARGMPNYPVIPPTPPVGKEVTVYHALPNGLLTPMRQPVKPDFYVDVSSVLAAKRDMLALHRSQKEWLDASQGIDSYLEYLETLSREMGKMSGKFEFAEGWTRHLHYGFCDEDANPLVEDLAQSLVLESA